MNQFAQPITADHPPSLSSQILTDLQSVNGMKYKRESIPHYPHMRTVGRYSRAEAVRQFNAVDIMSKLIALQAEYSLERFQKLRSLGDNCHVDTTAREMYFKMYDECLSEYQRAHEEVQQLEADLADLQLGHDIELSPDVELTPVDQATGKEDEKKHEHKQVADEDAEMNGVSQQMDDLNLESENDSDSDDDMDELRRALEISRM